MLITLLKLVLILVFLELSGCAALHPLERPHIVFIFADDYGWSDVSFHGSQQIPTPNIDALANDGVILNNYYVQPICTPSRTALLTGKYPIRVGLQHFVIPDGSPYGLPPYEKILPQYLKEQGYATHGIGKWHLGYFKSEYLPSNRGFDSFFGYWNGYEQYFTHFAQGDGKDNPGLDLHDNTNNYQWEHYGKYSTEVFTKKAVNIIESHDPQQPLFLYFAHQAPHVGIQSQPLSAPEEYIERFFHIKDPRRRIFAGMVSALDDSVGEVFSALDKAGILDDTVIIFSSDNGGEVQQISNTTGSNFPLRGSKFTLWEGGVRATAFVWNHFLRFGKKITDELMHVTDWLPTLYSLAGGNASTLQGLDGFNQWPLICCGGASKRDEILLNMDPKWNQEGIRKGKYKLVKGTCYNGTLDTWFSREGKFTYGDDFTEDDLRIYNQVYKEHAQKSLVQSILQKNFGKKYFEDFCPTTANFQPNSQKSVQHIRKCNEEYEKIVGNCMCPVIVECGQNVFRECDPVLEACLFNVEEDPCEYNNIAAVEPGIVAELEGLLNYYRSQSVPILNQPRDPCSNPKYYDHLWVPWKDPMYLLPSCDETES